MPRRSGASLGVVPVAPTPREPPPRGMPEDEAALWTQTLAGLPRDWIPPAAYALLEIFVASVINMRACKAIMLAEPEGTKAHQQAARFYRDEARMILRLAKTLRLGPRHDRTKLRTVGPRPWHLGGPGGGPPVNNFNGWGWDDPTAPKEKPGGDEPDVA